MPRRIRMHYIYYICYALLLPVRYSANKCVLHAGLMSARCVHLTARACHVVCLRHVVTWYVYNSRHARAMHSTVCPHSLNNVVVAAAAVACCCCWARDRNSREHAAAKTYPTHTGI